MLFALLAACDTDPSPGTCPEDAAPEIAVCFAGDGLTADEDPFSFDVDGTVVSVERGARPDSCTVIGNETPDEGLVVVLTDAEGLAYTVLLDLPDLPDTFLAVGDPVSLSGAYYHGSMWTPDEGVLTLTGPATSVILARALSLDRLPASALTVSDGGTRCEVDDGCGVYTKHDMDAAVGDTVVTVPYAEEVEADGLRLIHGGYDVMPPEDNDVCNDWFPPGVTVAVVGG